MSDPKREKKIQDFIKKMEAERGYLPSQWAYLVKKDFEYMEAYNNLHRLATQDGKALPEKYRQLVFIGVLAFRGLDGPLYEHCKRALRCGATKQEILEAIETVIIPGGAPTMGAGLKALIRIEEEEKERKRK